MSITVTKTECAAEWNESTGNKRTRARYGVYNEGVHVANIFYHMNSWLIWDLHLDHPSGRCTKLALAKIRAKEFYADRRVG